VSFSGNGRLHFVDEKTKVDSACYVGRLLPDFEKNCTRLLATGFIFQQEVRQCTQLVLSKIGFRQTASTSLPKMVASKFARTKLSWTTTSAGNARCLLQAPPKTKINRRTERNVAVNLGQPAPGTDRQGCEGISKATEDSGIVNMNF